MNGFGVRPRLFSRPFLLTAAVVAFGASAASAGVLALVDNNVARNVSEEPPGARPVSQPLQFASGTTDGGVSWTGYRYSRADGGVCIDVRLSGTGEAPAQTIGGCFDRSPGELGWGLITTRTNEYIVYGFVPEFESSKDSQAIKADLVGGGQVSSSVVKGAYMISSASLPVRVAYERPGGSVRSSTVETRRPPRGSSMSTHS